MICLYTSGNSIYPDLSSMNEESAVLEFFSKPENLPLGLSVAEQMDEIRNQMNSRFWVALKLRFNTNFAVAQWQTIEDRNAEGVFVGLQYKLADPQHNGLFPMLEQQFLGGVWRIFFGLMWQAPPSPDQLALPAVAALKNDLNKAGFKANENFLAWQWTGHYPRRSDFLQRFAYQPDAILNDFEAVIKPVLPELHASIVLANESLKKIPRTVGISLDQLRRKRED